MQAALPIERVGGRVGTRHGSGGSGVVPGTQPTHTQTSQKVTTIPWINGVTDRGRSRAALIDALEPGTAHRPRIGIGQPVSTPSSGSSELCDESEALEVRQERAPKERSAPRFHQRSRAQKGRTGIEQ